MLTDLFEYSPRMTGSLSVLQKVFKTASCGTECSTCKPNAAAKKGVRNPPGEALLTVPWCPQCWKMSSAGTFAAARLLLWASAAGPPRARSHTLMTWSSEPVAKQVAAVGDHSNRMMGAEWCRQLKRGSGGASVAAEDSFRLSHTFRLPSAAPAHISQAVKVGIQAA